MSLTPFSDYDTFAWFYDRHWNTGFSAGALQIFDQLVGHGIPPDARILDLCCGVGHLTRLLAARGYRMTGIDGSAEMLRYARRNVPGVEFHLGDARDFVLPADFHAVVSTFDSLNHILKVEELAAAFRNAWNALLPGGYFLFDLNTEEGYDCNWQRTFAIVEPDNVCVVQTDYNREERLAGCTVTMFRLQATWQRTDLLLMERCYPDSQVRAALEEAGFTGIAAYDGDRDLNMPGLHGMGRNFWLALKPA